jgi:hypothetical protein
MRKGWTGEKNDFGLIIPQDEGILHNCRIGDE